MSDDSQELVVDVQKAFHFRVNDVDSAQSIQGLPEAYQQKAMKKLAVAREKFIGALVAGKAQSTEDEEAKNSNYKEGALTIITAESNSPDNTKSSVKSRFNNKVFNGEVIVITSSVPIHYWYTDYRTANSLESLDQLYRRISCYIVVRPDVVAIYDDGVNENGAPTGTPTIIENELVRKIKLEKEKSNIGNLFKQIDMKGV